MKMIVKRICVALLVLCFTTGMTDVAAEAAVKLNRTSVKIEKNDTILLKLKGRHGKASWKSSNKRVAVVNKKGKVTARNKGIAVVSCTVDGKTYKCHVTVMKPKATEAHAHYYEEEITKEPTCLEGGEKTFTCEDCGDSYTVPLPAGKHNFQQISTVAPSKAGHGYSLFQCSLCGKTEERDRVDYNPTQQQVYNDIMDLKEQYPTGMKWDESNLYDTPYKGAPFHGHACGAFALTISDSVFGDLPYRKIAFDPNNLRVGDIVTTISPTAHAVIVLEVYPTYMVVTEGNLNEKVYWGRIIQYSNITALNVYRRYPV